MNNMFEISLRKTKQKLLNLYDNLTGVSSYQKFVIIARSRTGSNLLISLLNTNPKIRAFGEEFSLLGNSNFREIYNRIFPKKSNKTIGFKIFYYHPLDSDDKSIWDTLKNDQDLKIIHLQRKNLLRVHISRLIAAKTDKWTSSQSNDYEAYINKMVYIDTDELFEDFEITTNQINKINYDFQNHEMIDVFYEDLVNNKDAVMSNIFDFLNVAYTITNSKLKKQNPESIKHLVLNYKELNEKLTESDFTFMLEE